MKKNHTRSVPGTVPAAAFNCLTCNMSFSKKFNMLRHAQTHKFVSDTIPVISANALTAVPVIPLKIAPVASTSAAVSFQPMPSTSAAVSFQPVPSTSHGLSATRFCCETCPQSFSRKDHLVRHSKLHEEKPAAEPLVPLKRTRVEPVATAAELKESAFEKRFRTFKFSNTEGSKNLKCFFRYKQAEITSLLSDEILYMELKVNYKAFCVYSKMTDGGPVTSLKSFKTKNAILLYISDLNEHYDEAVDKMLMESSEFEEKGSGWTLEEIVELELGLNRFNPLRASSFIKLPPAIENKHAVVNVKNSDQECFRWAVLSAIHQAASNVGDLYNYLPHKDTLNFTGISFPVQLENVPKFIRQNNIAVNVYSLDDKLQVYPLHVSKLNTSIHIDLLYYKTATNQHYCWIKHLSRLVSSQLSAHKNEKHICRRCLSFFGREDLLNKHSEICGEHKEARVEMPTEEDKWLQFKNFQRSLRVPFVIYADFECLTTDISSCEPSTDKSFSHRYQLHEPMSFCYYIAYSHGFFKPPFVYRGADAPQVFIKQLLQEAKEIETIYTTPKPPLPLDDETKRSHEEAKTCYLCSKDFTRRNHKVLDHCHILGKYRGAACNNCNLKLKHPSFLPVIFHNLTNYDAHLFIKHLGEDKGEIFTISKNEEQYISFSKKISPKFSLRFLDSLHFMPSSLDTLVKNLDADQFIHMRKIFPNDKVDLLLRKGVYPYDYMSKWSRCDETALPPIEAFYSHLNESDISLADYEHAQKIWSEFKITNLGKYSDLYVTTDVLLLADVFENFRRVCHTTYQLDPAWYYTAPGLSWDAMLLMTKVRIELLTEYEKLLFVERGIRGGISQCIRRYSRANNKYLPDFNPDEPSNYLLYLDANNLYGWAMSQPLPLRDFQWCNEPIDVTNIPDDSPFGYILEVDLEYPANLHDLHSDFPFTPEKVVPPECKEKRLMTTLYGKRNYILHYRNLKQCLSHGLKLKKIHNVLKFQQSPWLKEYIDHNTRLRSQATNEFEKDFFKLQNNYLWENFRKYP